MKTTYFRLTATLFLLVAIGLEVNHSFVRQVPWRGFELAANFASFPLIAAWGLAVAGLWSAKSALKPWIVIGIIFLITHGIVISTGGNRLAAAYIFCGLLAGLFGGLAHAKKERAAATQTRTKLRIAS